MDATIVRLVKERAESEKKSAIEVGRCLGLKWAKTAHWDDLYFAAVGWIPQYEEDPQDCSYDPISKYFSNRLGYKEPIDYTDPYFSNLLKGWKESVEAIWGKVEKINIISN